MAENTPHVSETFEAKPETKQFSLGASFEAYAKTKWLSEKWIQMARTEIQDRFAKFNTENMDDRRFRNVRGTIESIINNEIGKAQSLLAARSEALAGTSVKETKTETQTRDVQVGPTNITTVNGNQVINIPWGGIVPVNQLTVAQRIQLNNGTLTLKVQASIANPVITTVSSRPDAIATWALNARPVLESALKKRKDALDAT